MPKYLDYTFEDIIIDSPNLIEKISYNYDTADPNKMTTPAYLADFLITEAQANAFRDDVLSRFSALDKFELEDFQLEGCKQSLDSFFMVCTHFKSANGDEKPTKYQHEDGFYHFKMKSLRDAPRVLKKEGDCLYNLNANQIKQIVTPGSLVTVKLAFGIQHDKLAAYFNTIYWVGKGIEIEHKEVSRNPQEGVSWGGKIKEIRDLPDDTEGEVAMTSTRPTDLMD